MAEFTRSEGRNGRCFSTVQTDANGTKRTFRNVRYSVAMEQIPEILLQIELMRRDIEMALVLLRKMTARTERTGRSS